MSAGARISRSASWRARCQTWSVSAAQLQFDPAKPDGTPRKLLDVSRLRQPGLGAAHSRWRTGIAATYDGFAPT